MPKFNNIQGYSMKNVITSNPLGNALETTAQLISVMTAINFAHSAQETVTPTQHGLYLVEEKLIALYAELTAAQKEYDVLDIIATAIKNGEIKKDTPADEEK